jgi:rifampicin phosphotransferase
VGIVSCTFSNYPKFCQQKLNRHTQIRFVLDLTHMEQQSWILPLEKISADEIGRAGHKAVHLAALLQHGFEVPTGICVATEAYDFFVLTNGLQPLLLAVLMDLTSNAQLVPKVSQEIQTQFLSLPMPEELEKFLKHVFESFAPGEFGLAVRSSATAEDLPAASFAGQQETYLGIKTEEDFLKALVRCWASLWSERSITYRLRHGLNPISASMAIVLQQMLNPDYAGVVSSSYPISEGEREILVEVVPGLGEGLVEGNLSPDRYLIARRPPHKIIRKTQESKDKAYVVAEKGGTQLKSIQAVVPLNENLLTQLARDSMRIESIFKRPVEIEFAIVADKIFYLQARPVTVVHDTKLKLFYGSPEVEDALQGKLTVWTDYKLRETMPYPLAPLAWNFWNYEVFPALITAMTGMHDSHELFPYFHFIDRINGRLFWNLNVLLAGPFTAFLLKKKFEKLDTEANGQLTQILRSSEFHPVKVPKKWQYLRIRFGVYLRLAKIYFHWRKYFDVNLGWQELKNFEERLESEKRDPSSFNELEILNEVSRYIRTLALELFKMAGWIVMGSVAFANLRRISLPWTGIPATHYLEGLEKDPSIESALELWQLAQKAGGIKNLLPNMVDFDEERFKKELSKTENGKEFLNELNEFLEKHEDGSVRELDLLAPRWKEDPAFVVQMIKNYCNHDPNSASPVQKWEELKKKEAKTTELGLRRVQQGFLNKLRFWRQSAFRITVAVSQAHMPFRSAVEHNCVRILQYAREMYLVIGERMKANDLIQNKEDVFYFSFPELKHILRGKEEAEDLEEVILRRKSEWQYYLPQTPPSVITNQDPGPGKRKTIILKRQLEGLGVSAGREKGKAHILREPWEEATLNEGEILILPFMDPGWTPLLLTAGGLVVESGDILGHGAIAARELAIPAVFQVRNATQLIRNGDQVLVDADNGVVRLL